MTITRNDSNGNKITPFRLFSMLQFSTMSHRGGNFHILEYPEFSIFE